ncbi:hypothetical protein Tco_0715859 [Tanacetum coccineum]
MVDSSPSEPSSPPFTNLPRKRYQSSCVGTSTKDSSTPFAGINPLLLSSCKHHHADTASRIVTAWRKVMKNVSDIQGPALAIVLERLKSHGVFPEVHDKTRATRTGPTVKTTSKIRKSNWLSKQLAIHVYLQEHEIDEIRRRCGNLTSRNCRWYSQALCLYIDTPTCASIDFIIRGTLLHSTVFGGVDISGTLVVETAGTLCSTPALGGSKISLMAMFV